MNTNETETTQKIKILQKELKKISKKDISLMEVCGTHTMSIARSAIKSLLPDNINIISGPGCPVCVTSAGDIQAAIDIAKKENTIIATFGDMLKVPSNNDSLQNYQNVEIVYSPLEALQMADNNKNKEVIFLGIGFETTTPLIAATIKAAKTANVKNFSVISMHKTVPVALQVILGAEDNKIDGLILPGHVSAITGRKYFDFIKDYKTNGVIAGFEPLQVLECIFLLTKNINEEKVEVHNNYPKLVTEDGNDVALKTMYEIFEPATSNWRGIGNIPESGLAIKNEYREFDAIKKFSIKIQDIDDAPGCLCGAILMGKKRPHECGYFGNKCTPANPVGPCMVSSEGTCAAYYKYQPL